jgi:hypothetical protein
MRLEAGVTSTEAQGRAPGYLNAAISNQVVRLFAEYTGRGPTKAHTSIRDNVVACVTQDTMTKWSSSEIRGEFEGVITAATNPGDDGAEVPAPGGLER